MRTKTTTTKARTRAKSAPVETGELLQVPTKTQHRTMYLSKAEKIVIITALEYWIENAPKTLLETLVVDKFVEMKNKVQPQKVEKV